MKCGLVFIPREFKNIHKYYKDDGYFKTSPNLSLRKALISKSLLIEQGLSRIQEIHKKFKINFLNKSILDIGCAYGEMLYILKTKYNSNVIGIEASQEVAAIGSQMFKLNIKPLLLEEFDTKHRFDIILCSHTFEHVSNPLSFLKKIRSLMHKDTIFYLEVPNLLKPSGGFDLNTFLYSEHIQTFTHMNLSYLLESNGFKVIKSSDVGFLKFTLNTSKIKNKLSHITFSNTSKENFNFLLLYKNNYNLKAYLTVYLNKAFYLIKLIGFTTYDFFLKVISLKNIYNTYVFGIASLRAAFWYPFFKKMGMNVQIMKNVTILSPQGIEIGNNVFINRNTEIGGHGGLKIGNNVLIGSNCNILTANHNFENRNIPIMYQDISSKPVVIQDDVWIGSNSTILPGVTIGSGSIVGANSVVTKNVNKFSIYGGCPAKFIKSR